MAVTDADVFDVFVKQMATAWDASNYKMCSFKHVFYDDLSQEGADGRMAAPPADVLHARRAQAMQASDTVLWQRADDLNPDRTRFCPVQVTGFQALHERHVQQQQLSRQVHQLLLNTKDELTKLREQRDDTVELMLRHSKQRQIHLCHRIMRLMVALEKQKLSRAFPGQEPPLTSAEVGYVQQLHQLAHAVRQPGQGRSRLDEISAQLAATPTTVGSAVPPAELDMDALGKWLSAHQQAIRRLVELQTKYKDDCELMLSLTANGRGGAGGGAHAGMRL